MSVVRPIAAYCIPLAWVWVLSLSCGSSAALSEGRAEVRGEVITFDRERLDEDGLVGPPNGLRALSYEFCIPDVGKAVDEVHGLDVTVEFHRQSPGRIGCEDDEILCIGHTHQPEWRSVLTELADLSYVTRIDESFGE